MLRPDAACSRDFRKVCSTSQNRHWYSKDTGNSLSGPVSWWGRISRNHQGEANSVSQVDGDSDMASAFQVCVERAQKRNNSLCQHFIWEKAAAPALTLMPDTSVPLCISLVPFELLPQCWGSEGVSASKSMNGPFKRSCLGLWKASISLSHNPCWFL